MEYVIETNNLTKLYRKQKAIDGVNLHLKKGEIYGLIGENGSGKSTILKTILGIINPTSGEVAIFGGKSPEDLERARSSIGFIIEYPAFFPYMSARDNLEYYRLQRGIKDKNVVGEVLKTVELDQAGKKKFKNFSLGMKQRLGLGLSLMIDPDILILDEPINGLDPKGIIELRKLILKINREKGVTVLVSSHILDELSQIATVYGFMSKGKLVKEITAKNLMEECRQFLKIKVENTEEATTILEELMQTLDYKVSNDGYIHLYDFVNRPEEVIKVLYENGIVIKSIREEGMKLEDYYMDLIGGSLNA